MEQGRWTLRILARSAGPIEDDLIHHMPPYTMVPSSPCLPSMRYLFRPELTCLSLEPTLSPHGLDCYQSYIDHSSFFLICYKIAYPSHSCFLQVIPRSMFFVIIFFIPSIASASRSSFFFLNCISLSSFFQHPF